MNYRNKKLLQLAKDFPYCMNCGSQNCGDVVMAHSNQSRDGKGMSIKAHDFRVAALCYECHMMIDQGKGLSREDRIAVWETAHRATMGHLFWSGMVEVV